MPLYCIGLDVLKLISENLTLLDFQKIIQTIRMTYGLMKQYSVSDILSEWKYIQLDLKMSNDSYTVPTLSLTNSRSRKNIPTKDAYQPRTYLSQTNNIPFSSNPYMNKKEQQPTNYNKESRTVINYNNLPPRPRMNQMPPMMPRRQQKEISRNVYLSSEEESGRKNYNQQETRNEVEMGNTSGFEVERARQILSQSNSGGSLFRNPQSRVEIENEVRRQTNNMEFKKIDINKALFDRKLAKIMQEINFYQEELNGLYTQELTDHLEELEDIKRQNKQAQNKILADLNSLII